MALLDVLVETWNLTEATYHLENPVQMVLGEILRDISSLGQCGTAKHFVVEMIGVGRKSLPIVVVVRRLVRPHQFTSTIQTEITLSTEVELFKHSLS